MTQFKILILITTAIFLSSCGTLKEGFKNQKKNNSDEFLVEKKSPLVMPPNFDELPVPQEEDISSKKDENEIKRLLSENKEDKTQNDIGQESKTVEDSLLKKIKNN